MLSFVVVVLVLVAVAAAYLYGVEVGARWGRRTAEQAYEAGRDDAVRYLMQ